MSQVIQSLASKALQPWHWDHVSELLGKQIETDELTLQARAAEPLYLSLHIYLSYM